MTLIDQSGAPRGERYFAIYNPPVVNRAARHPPLRPAAARATWPCPS